MAKVILDLPTVLAADIAGSWIQINDLVKLDTACCQTSTRAKLKSIYSECNLSLKLSGQNNTDDLVAWSVKRDARVCELNINARSLLSVYQHYFVNSGARVTKIQCNLQSAPEHCYGPDTNAFIRTSAICCPNLLSFSLTASEYVNGPDVPLMDVLVKCTKLQDLQVRFSKTSGINLDHHSLQDIVCPALLTLTLENLLSGELVAALLKTAPNIRSLSLLHCSFQLDNGGTALESISPNTSTLDLKGVKDDMLVKIIDVCPNVKKISLLFGSQWSLLHMATHTSGLTMVNLSHANILDEGLFSLAQHHAHTLTYLGIMHCSKLSVPAINTTLRLCTQLTHFRCHFNGFTALLDFSLLANVTDLHFAINKDCSLFVSIAQYCQKLVHLRVDNYFDNDQWDGLNSIVHYCPQIATIKIFYHSTEKFIGKEKIKEWRCIRPNLVVTDE